MSMIDERCMHISGQSCAGILLSDRPLSDHVLVTSLLLVRANDSNIEDRGILNCKTVV